MDLLSILKKTELILSEGAVAERLRREFRLELHPTLFNAPLVRDYAGREAMRRVYLSYRRVARAAGLPILLCAPTWRLDRHRIEESGCGEDLLHEVVSFMLDVQRAEQDETSLFIVGALLAPKNDCYSPLAALSRETAASFHGWQVEKLAGSGVDCLLAQTIPAVSEALGMADALSATPLPYFISFVIDRNGRVLDGTPLADAIDLIDDAAATPPAGYLVNCVYPTFIRAEHQRPELFQRLVGIQANASSKDHSELDGAETLQQDPLSDWKEQMLRLNRQYGVKILGGCCGTTDAYLEALTMP